MEMLITENFIFFMCFIPQGVEIAFCLKTSIVKFLLLHRFYTFYQRNVSVKKKSPGRTVLVLLIFSCILN